MLSKDIEIVDQIMDAPWMQRGPSYHSWQRIKTALMERRKTEGAAKRVRHAQHRKVSICPRCKGSKVYAPIGFGGKKYQCATCGGTGKQATVA